MLKPLQRSAKPLKNIGFDIETYGDDNKFLLASFYFDKDDYITFNDKDNMIRYIIDNHLKFRDSIIWAHNLAFDFLGLFYGTQYIQDFKFLQRGSDFILAQSYVYNDTFNITRPQGHKQSDTKILFYDTFNFHKSSLKNIGKIIDAPKMQSPSFIGQKPKARPEWDYMIKYNIQDSKVTKKFADFLSNTFTSLGCNMKSTIASTSMDLFRRKFLKYDLFTPYKKDLPFFYKAYFGGRTEIIQRGYNDEKMNVYDFNSVYPAVMQKESYPDPNTMHRNNKITKNQIWNNDGITEVTLEKAQHDKIPYLPFRSKKLLFPTGKIKGVYTNLEIRNAVEKYGYRIKDIGKGLYYLDNIRLFKDFVDTLYSMRMKFKAQNSPMQLPVKILMNSLYGKFGQSIDDKTELIHFNNITAEQYNDPNTDRLGQSDFFRIKKTYDRIPDFINPIIAIYVTAHAREKLYDALYHKQDDVFYMDTDSLFTTRSMNNSSALGDLKKEYTAKEYYLVKPKFYCVRRMDDKVTCKIKGMHHMTQDMDFFKDIMRKPKATYTKFTKMRESLRRGMIPNQKLEVEKIFGLEDDKRFWKYKFNYKNFQDSKPLSV